MSLPKFNIIVTIDGGNGMSKDGKIPGNSLSNGKFTRDITMGNGKNAVLMGRNTYESIPLEHRPLVGRHCVVISKTMRQEFHNNITVCPTILDAFLTIGSCIKSYEEIFIMGGEQIYKEILRDFMYLCKRIIVTKFKMDYECELFFPWDEVKDLPQMKSPERRVGRWY